MSDTTKKYIDQIKTLKGDTLSLRTKTSELENDSGFVTEDQLATKQDKLTAGVNITISEDGTISANSSNVDLPSNIVLRNENNEIYEPNTIRIETLHSTSSNKEQLFYHNSSTDEIYIGSQDVIDNIIFNSNRDTIVRKNGVNYTNIHSGNISEYVSTGSNSYELPTASTTTLGGVKVDGTTIIIDENGVISSTTTSNGESSGVTSVNEKTGDVVLTGADINITYTHDFEEVTTDLNSFASSVDADLSNLTELVDNAITPETIGNYLPTNVVTGTGITQIVRLTQTEYDALTTKDENTFYVIVGE